MSHPQAAARRKDKSEVMKEICSVRLGQALYGVPISHILEIVGQARPQPVPLAPGFVGGLVHYRGDVLTAVSLRHLLGLAPAPGNSRTSWCSKPRRLLRVAGGFGGRGADSRVKRFLKPIPPHLMRRAGTSSLAPTSSRTRC